MQRMDDDDEEDKIKDNTEIEGWLLKMCRPTSIRKKICWKYRHCRYCGSNQTLSYTHKQKKRRQVFCIRSFIAEAETGTPYTFEVYGVSEQEKGTRKLVFAAPNEVVFNQWICTLASTVVKDFKAFRQATRSAAETYYSASVWSGGRKSSEMDASEADSTGRHTRQNSAHSLISQQNGDGIGHKESTRNPLGILLSKKSFQRERQRSDSISPKSRVPSRSSSVNSMSSLKSNEDQDKRESRSSKPPTPKGFLVSKKSFLGRASRGASHSRSPSRPGRFSTSAERRKSGHERASRAASRSRSPPRLPRPLTSVERKKSGYERKTSYGNQSSFISSDSLPQCSDCGSSYKTCMSCKKLVCQSCQSKETGLQIIQIEVLCESCQHEELSDFDVLDISQTEIISVLSCDTCKKTQKERPSDEVTEGGTWRACILCTKHWCGKCKHKRMVKPRHERHYKICVACASVRNGPPDPSRCLLCKAAFNLYRHRNRCKQCLKTYCRKCCHHHKKSVGKICAVCAVLDLHGVGSSTPTAQESSLSQNTSQGSSDVDSSVLTRQSSAESQTDVDITQEIEEEENLKIEIPKTPFDLLKEDPEIQCFFKMASFGVPTEAACQKMIQESIDPEKIRIFAAGHGLSEEDINALLPSKTRTSDQNSSDVLKANSPKEKDSNKPKTPLEQSLKKKKNEIKLKRFYWDPLRDGEEDTKLENTVWSKRFDRQVAAPANLTAKERSDMARLFAAHKPTLSPQSGTKGGTSRRKTFGEGRGAGCKLVQLLEPRRSQNVSIAAAKFKDFDSYSALALAVLQMDGARMGPERLKVLEIAVPSVEEAKKLCGYSGPTELLPEGERLMRVLCSVPRFGPKLHSFQYLSTFDEVSQQISSDILTVTEACNQIMSSGGLARILETILAIGNLLNQGSLIGSADGFALDSLLKLSQTKSLDGQVTLLDYFIQMVYEKGEEDLLDVKQEIPALASGYRISETNVSNQFNLFRRGFTLLEEECKHVRTDLEALTARRENVTQSCQKQVIKKPFLGGGVQGMLAEIRSRGRQSQPKTGLADARCNLFSELKRCAPLVQEDSPQEGGNARANLLSAIRATQPPKPSASETVNPRANLLAAIQAQRPQQDDNSAASEDNPRANLLSAIRSQQGSKSSKKSNPFLKDSVTNYSFPVEKPSPMVQRQSQYEPGYTDNSNPFLQKPPFQESQKSRKILHQCSSNPGSDSKKSKQAKKNLNNTAAVGTGSINLIRGLHQTADRRQTSNDIGESDQSDAFLSARRSVTTNESDTSGDDRSRGGFNTARSNISQSYFSVAETHWAGNMDESQSSIQAQISSGGLYSDSGSENDSMSVNVPARRTYHGAPKKVPQSPPGSSQTSDDQHFQEKSVSATSQSDSDNSDFEEFKNALDKARKDRSDGTSKLFAADASSDSDGAVILGSPAAVRNLSLREFSKRSVLPTNTSDDDSNSFIPFVNSEQSFGNSQHLRQVQDNLIPPLNFNKSAPRSKTTRVDSTSLSSYEKPQLAVRRKSNCHNEQSEDISTSEELDLSEKPKLPVRRKSSHMFPKQNVHTPRAQLLRTQSFSEKLFPKESTQKMQEQLPKRHSFYGQPNSKQGRIDQPLEEMSGKGKWNAQRQPKTRTKVTAEKNAQKRKPPPPNHPPPDLPKHPPPPPPKHPPPSPQNDECNTVSEAKKVLITELKAGIAQGIKLKSQTLPKSVSTDMLLSKEVMTSFLSSLDNFRPSASKVIEDINQKVMTMKTSSSELAKYLCEEYSASSQENIMSILFNFIDMITVSYQKLLETKHRGRRRKAKAPTFARRSSSGGSPSAADRVSVRVGQCVATALGAGIVEARRNSDGVCVVRLPWGTGYLQPETLLAPGDQILYPGFGLVDVLTIRQSDSMVEVALPSGNAFVHPSTLQIPWSQRFFETRMVPYEEKDWNAEQEDSIFDPYDSPRQANEDVLPSPIGKDTPLAGSGAFNDIFPAFVSSPVLKSRPLKNIHRENSTDEFDGFSSHHCEEVPPPLLAKRPSFTSSLTSSFSISNDIMKSIDAQILSSIADFKIAQRRSMELTRELLLAEASRRGSFTSDILETPRPLSFRQTLPKGFFG